MIPRMAIAIVMLVITPAVLVIGVVLLWLLWLRLIFACANGEV